MENTGKRSTDFFAVFEVKMALFSIKKAPKALKYMAKELNRYLKRGKYADLLKSKIGVGVGFVDGNIEILYKK